MLQVTKNRFMSLPVIKAEIEGELIALQPPGFIERGPKISEGLER